MQNYLGFGLYKFIVLAYNNVNLFGCFICVNNNHCQQFCFTEPAPLVATSDVIQHDFRNMNSCHSPLHALRTFQY